jgi:hypothetical protein
VVQNIVLNNSSHNFSAWADGLRAEEDKTKVTGSDGSDAAVVASLRAQLESGALAASGRGHHVNASA